MDILRGWLPPIKDLPTIPTANHRTVNLITRRQPTVLTEDNLITAAEAAALVNRRTVIRLTVIRLTVNRPTVNRPTVNRPTVNLPTLNPPTSSRPSHRHRRSPSYNRADPASANWPRKRWSTPAWARASARLWTGYCQEASTAGVREVAAAAAPAAVTPRSRTIIIITIISRRQGHLPTTTARFLMVHPRSRRQLNRHQLRRRIRR